MLGLAVCIWDKPEFKGQPWYLCGGSVSWMCPFGYHSLYSQFYNHKVLCQLWHSLKWESICLLTASAFHLLWDFDYFSWTGSLCFDSHVHILRLQSLTFMDLELLLVMVDFSNRTIKSHFFCLSFHVYGFLLHVYLWTTSMPGMHSCQKGHWIPLEIELQIELPWVSWE